MTISIKITGYNKHTAGPLRTYLFHINNLPMTTGKENQFSHGHTQAQAMLSGLAAADPMSDFEIAAIDTDAPGTGTHIDGEYLWDVRDRMVAEYNEKRGVKA